MMTFDEFVTEVIEKVQEKLADEYGVEKNIVFKNNDTERVGIVLKKEDSKISPVVYLEQYYAEYERGAEVEEIIDAIVDLSHKKIVEPYNLDFFTDFDKVKDFVHFKLISKDKNRKLLEEVPHKDYLDMAVVVYVVLDNMVDNGMASILVKNEHLNLWKKSFEDLYMCAIDNTPKLFKSKIDSMSQVLNSMYKNTTNSADADEFYDYLCRLEETESNLPHLRVLSNNVNLYGASVVLYGNLLQECYKTYGNFFLLPSSVHEWVLIEDYGENPETLAEMVKEINLSSVKEDEVLSDHVYRYNPEKNELEICV